MIKIDLAMHEYKFLPFYCRMLTAINEMRKVMMAGIQYLLTPDKTNYHPQASYFDVVSNFSFYISRVMLVLTC